ncbi:hypothetical protein Q5530_29065 [Saccharothrix sp. BKS2]|uniref:hypothetical protein n=1 Tax=Saccharothrix sp. BKS2 TaxID=3064400 RepID=UPI0039EB3603
MSRRRRSTVAMLLGLGVGALTAGTCTTVFTMDGPRPAEADRGSWVTPAVPRIDPIDRVPSREPARWSQSREALP